MKKQVILIALSLLTSTLASCSEVDSQVMDIGNEKTVSVSVHDANGNVTKKIRVKPGESIGYQIDNPTPKNQRLVFDYWRASTGDSFNFETTVVFNNIDVYPKYRFDQTYTTKELQGLSSSLMMVKTKAIYKEPIFWGLINFDYTEVSQGSSFVFGDGKIMTNAHVVDVPSTNKKGYKLDRVKYYVCRGKKEYECDLKYKDFDHDFSVLTLKNKQTLTSFKLASNWDINDSVCSYSHPSGANEFITYGKIRKYESISYGDERRTYTCNMIRVSNQAYPGSSGSPLFNTNLEVIGIISAANKSADYKKKNSEYACCQQMSSIIPVLKKKGLY